MDTDRAPLFCLRSGLRAEEGPAGAAALLVETDEADLRRALLSLSPPAPRFHMSARDFVRTILERAPTAGPRRENLLLIQRVRYRRQRAALKWTSTRFLTALLWRRCCLHCLRATSPCCTSLWRR